MFKKIYKKILQFNRQKDEEKKTHPGKKPKGIAISKTLEKNIKLMQETLGDSDDVIIRRIEVSGIKLALFYLEGMVDTKVINEDILKPLMLETRMAEPKKTFDAQGLLSQIMDKAAPVGEVEITKDFDRLVFLFLTGVAAVLIDGNSTAIMVSAKGWKQRAIAEPEIENVIRGPKEGFVETLRTNTTLIRRRLRDPNLRIITTQIGRRSKTDVAMLYIKGIVNPDLVDEVKKRLDTIDTDVILESGYVEQFIEDSWWSPFPTVQETERPDRVAAGLAEGRVAILVDNTPFALMVPVNINMFMIASEDYYLRWTGGTVSRLIRFGANFLAMLLPALYIALTSYHPEMLPTGLAITIASNRENVPFPAFVEAFLMELSMELLREAGIRLPGPISQTIGIVGGLVVGTAAVQANIVGPIMVIIVAFTAIASFVVPTVGLGVAVRQMRFMFMLLATILGIYGIMLGLLALIGHLATLKSFGLEYLGPFAPLQPRDLKDVMIRLPLLSMHTRPRSLKTPDPVRMNDKRQNDIQREADSEKYGQFKK